MTMDGLNLFAASREIAWLAGGKIEKIHQPEKDELVLALIDAMLTEFTTTWQAEAAGLSPAEALAVAPAFRANAAALTLAPWPGGTAMLVRTRLAAPAVVPPIGSSAAPGAPPSNPGPISTRSSSELYRK